MQAEQFAEVTGQVIQRTEPCVNERPGRRPPDLYAVKCWSAVFHCHSAQCDSHPESSRRQRWHNGDTMLDVRRLRLLRELSIRGTIAGVADALHLSPSAISQQLSQLEKEAGAPLLRKVGRNLRLTPQGEIMVKHVERVLAQLEVAESEIAASLDVATGTTRIAIFQSAALAFMPRMLAILAETAPDVRVRMTQREPETALKETWAQDFDLVVAERYPHHSAPWQEGMDRVELIQDPLRLAVPDTPAYADITDIAQVADKPWVVEPIGAASRHFAEQQCRVAGFEPDVRFETADLQAHVALIESGNAVGILSGLILAHREVELRLLELPDNPLRTVFTATRDSLVAQPSVAACRAALAAAVAEYTAQE